MRLPRTTGTFWTMVQHHGIMKGSCFLPVMRITKGRSSCGTLLQSVPATTARNRACTPFFSSSRSSGIASLTTRIPATAATTRFLGSKASFGNPPDPPGQVHIENNQRDLRDIDLDRIRETARDVAELLGYGTYDVSILLVGDREMIQTNGSTRGIRSATDILSFPFHCSTQPGVIVEPDFDIPDYYTLGDMMIDVPYVMRRCREDQEDSLRAEEEDDDDGEEEEEDRGVSAAMATNYDAEDRINMLLVHGMLHLVGYDHEDDQDYILMTTREEEILECLGLIPPNQRKEGT